MKRAIITATAAVLLVVPFATGCEESTDTGAAPSAAAQQDNGDSGDSASNGGPRTAPDPCSLMTDEKAAELAGTTVEDHTGPEDAANLRECRWNFSDGKTLSLTLGITGGNLDLEAALDGAKEFDGIGDRAVSTGGNELYVQVGALTMVLNDGYGVDNHQKIAKYLVTQVK